MDDPYKEVLICEYPDDALFDIFLHRIIKDFKGHLLHKVQNQDVRYYDFLINQIQITLHMETFVGITVFPTELNQSNHETQNTITTIGMNLKLLYDKHHSDIKKSDDKTKRN